MTAPRIYFAQHGLAVDKTEDPERPLSDTGKQQTQNIANALLKSRTPISSIFHSGKLRASQTAEIIAATLNIATISMADHLSPNDDVTLLAQNLNTDGALYIGHLPHLEKLVSHLVTDKEAAGIMKFQNSAIVCLIKEEDRYHIKWLLTPELASNI